MLVVVSFLQIILIVVQMFVSTIDLAHNVGVTLVTGFPVINDHVQVIQ